MQKVRQSGANGCWLWAGATKPNGYGNFALNGKTLGAHRAAWLLMRGDIPAGMQVCHCCDVRACVNPEHLFIGTQQDNMDDMDAKGRRVVADHAGPANPMYGRRHSPATRAMLSAGKRGRYTGSAHPRATVDEARIREIRALRASGATAKAIAAQLEVSFHVVRNVISSKSWRHV